jgi:hypothetical protein
MADSGGVTCLQKRNKIIYDSGGVEYKEDCCQKHRTRIFVPTDSK